MEQREAIVLAGGFGTRLRGVVSDVPKPMAPVAGRPFLCWLLDDLVRQGYTRTVLATGYMHEKVASHFGNAYQGMEIAYARETTPLGTGGAIAKALPHCGCESVTVLNGDTLFRINLRKIATLAKEKDADLVVALRNVDDTSRYGSVSVGDDGRVNAFHEKADCHGPGLINGGIYQLDTALLKDFPAGRNFSFEREVLQREYQSRRFYGMRSDGYFIDIGIPEDYARAQTEFCAL